MRDFSQSSNSAIKIVLHIAQPENALNWFKDAQTNDVTDFDIIGLSYYSKWSTYALGDLHRAIDSLKTTYKKEIVIVETAYPHTLENIDAAGNILGEDAIIPNFPATPQGQKNYLIKLIHKIKKIKIPFTNLLK